GVADGDALVRDESRPAGMQSEICEAAGGVGNQGQGTIADYRRADTDEPVAGAKTETAVEDGGDFRACIALAKFAGQNAGSQDRDDAIRVGRFPRGSRGCRSPQPLPACGESLSKPHRLVCPDVEAHHAVSPIAPMAIAAASALDSATIAPASTSVRTWAVRRCGSLSVPVPVATTSGPPRPARTPATWRAGWGCAR